MCTLRFCVESMVVTLFVHFYLSQNCVISALPGYSILFYSMFFSLVKNRKPNMILLCKLSIRL